MEKKNRRKFLKEFGIAGSLIAFGKYIGNAEPLFDEGGREFLPQAESKIKGEFPVDFQYAPSFWQSTYCFPDDPYKSLVGKNGELLYGHPGLEAELDAFAHRVWVGLKNEVKGQYVEQKLEAPEIPIITTKLHFADADVLLTSFATNRKEEGRVDNLLVEFSPKGDSGRSLSPLIVIGSKSEFKSKNEDDSRFPGKQVGAVSLEGDKHSLFMVVDSPVDMEKSSDGMICTLKSGAGQLMFFARFPQEGQTFDKVKDGLLEPKQLMAEARAFWQAWKPFDGNVNWQVNAEHQAFLTACTRNILQSREIKNGKKLFQVGPTVYRGLWFIDGTFILEAARYMGYDKEAQEGLEAMWDLQNEEGAFFAGAGKHHWKDTAAALYSLARQADLAQNWDFLQATWTDAYKAVMFLKNLRAKAVNDGTSNGKYGLLPRGFGDSGIGGIRSEFTNTIWTIIALKELVSVAQRLGLPRRDQVRDLYRDLLVLFGQAAKEEMRVHPKGFKYLPMLMKEDPAWSDPDPRKRPQPQAAQLYLSHAIFPGTILQKDDPIIPGHIELMKAVTQEDIPAETGWLAHDAVWPYNAPMVAQVYLWAKMPELARKTFAGFLNHASPLFAWREEQSLLASHLNEYIGDMPHNWASAECVRFLRHSLIMEDGERLRLIEGIVEEDLLAKKPIRIEYTPTRWGRVSLSFEPIDDKTWSMKFRRENFNQKYVPKLTYVEFPRHLPLKVQFISITGATAGSAEIGRMLVDGQVTSWEATFRNVG